MAFIKAKNYLTKYNLEDRIIVFNAKSATVKEAADLLKCTEGEIAKSMAFLIGKQPIIVVTAGDKKIDNKKFKQEFNIKAKMIPLENLNTLIGHEAGGICPFGINENVLVYLDSSLKTFTTVYPACGSDSSAVKITIKELEQVTNYKKWVDVCK
jgi:prolyl-tRNA editing enzyme YbaK/EbsC (Cys-tRNA(Pro) deacylase)